MKKTTEQRIGIGLTKEDIAILAALQERFGQIGPTAVFRMALRALELCFWFKDSEMFKEK